MVPEIDLPELAEYAASQMNHLFPDRYPVAMPELLPFVYKAMERVEFCFRNIAHPAYCENGHAKFDPLYLDQYCTYLYYLSNTVHKAEGDPRIAKKLYALNKALNGFNCMYDTDLPAIFRLIHGVGTVLGKAQYSDYLVVCQNCTVGAIRGIFPTMREGLILCAGASVIGECSIGSNVMISPGATIIKTDVPNDTLVVQDATHVFKPNSRRPIQNYFHEPN